MNDRVCQLQQRKNRIGASCQERIVMLNISGELPVTKGKSK